MLVRRRITMLAAAVCWVASAGWNGAAADPPLATLHAFSGGSDSSHPYGRLIFDTAGAFYGTTGGVGGANCSGDCGTVFKLAPPSTPSGSWTKSVLHTFTGPDGAFPQAGLIFDTAGALYGTTFRGGSSTNCTGGCGIVFKLAPPSTPDGSWTETVLYSFIGPGTSLAFGESDGAFPSGGLIFDTAGALYGTTFQGGDQTGAGTVFKLTPPSMPTGSWTETVLHRFAEHSFADRIAGAQPTARLIFDTAGALYGMTPYGGIYFGVANCIYGCGTVFKLTPPSSPSGSWNKSVLHTFTGGSDGGVPQDTLIFDTAGALYGTASLGGTSGKGIVFKLTPTPSPPWNESVLYNFAGGSDGAGPIPVPIFDSTGALYGTTSGGGSSPNCTSSYGTVFKLTPPSSPSGSWTETVLHCFSGGNDGELPDSELVTDGSGALYGTTVGSPGYGTVFKLGP